MHIARTGSILALALTAATSACSEQRVTAPVAAPASRLIFVGEDPGLAAVDYTLTGFDLGTLTLTGESVLLNLLPPNPIVPPNPVLPSFTGTFSADTRFVAARLDSYNPSDPFCPTLAADYNSLAIVSSSDGSAFYQTIGAMAEVGCHARVLVDLQTATIRSFQPVP